MMAGETIQRMRGLLVNVLCVFVACVVSLIGAEYVARWYFGDLSHAYSVATTRNVYHFYQYDPYLGWSNMPNARGTLTREEFTYPVSVNTYGMRQKEVSIEAGGDKPRIAFMGDSFLWGIGVADEQRYSDIVEKQSCIEALNFGASGYAPIQYYLMLDRVLRFKPQRVLLGFTYSNDMDDNVQYNRYSYYKPYAELDEGKLQIRGYPIPNTRLDAPKAYSFQSEWLAQWLGYSVLWQKIQDLIVQPQAEIVQKGMTGFNFELLYQYQGLPEDKRRLVDEAVAINKELLRAIKQKLDQAGIPLTVVGYASKCEYFSDCQGRDGMSPAPQQRSGAVDFLKQTLKELDIEFIDSVPLITPDDFWVSDGHWKPQGHEKVAGEISHYLKGKSIGCYKE